MRAGGHVQRTGRFASLGNRHFRVLFVSGIFTFLSMQVSVVARSWLAFEITGSNTGLGGVMLAFGVSTMIAIPYGGMLSDRFSKRGILMIAGVLQALTPLALGVAVVTGTEAYWMLIVSSALQGGTVSIMGPARLAFVSELTGRNATTNGVMLSVFSMQLARVVGPAAAGVLIGVALFGLTGVFFAASALGALSAVLVSGLPSGAPAQPSGRAAMAEIADGLRFVRSQPDVMRPLLLSFGIVLTGFTHIAFLPVVAEQVHDAGSTGFGLLNAASAVGAVVGTLTLANVQASRLVPFQYRSAAAFGLVLAVFAVMPNFYAALAVMVAVGATSGVFQAINNSLVVNLTPAEFHGRVQSLLMLSFSGFGIAALPIGLVADAVGIRTTLVGMGFLVIVVVSAVRAIHPHSHAADSATRTPTD